MIKFKKLSKDATIPTRGSEGAAGFDLYASEEGYYVISTGLAMAIPKGWVGLVSPRSGLAFKHGIDTMAGVIDSDYRGEVKVLLDNPYEVFFKKGDRVAQLIVVPVMTESMEGELDDTDRGSNGFGSTGA